MKTNFLSEFEIQQMAEAALTSYEFSCCWKRAFQEAAEFAADELGVNATRAQAATAVRIAQTGWEGIRNCVQAVQYRNA
jgi:hypothetical protein|tara:strand:+ start:344 stop:580 length:237 start_codon:yes stop_codon:yes gene_type:complete